ncbi:very low-density lipoprotein receptor-like [Macrosteles quadrilineatus]|uniref:very low-density lipoprotein receptor-like n=1 Tax=Macrosteles quadrilineatus TaxID=74068 RepID=UPI0023E1B2BB|nr:very low-density lipoprotein receptor-like [Macrosteles quadrilineatus]
MMVQSWVLFPLALAVFISSQIQTASADDKKVPCYDKNDCGLNGQVCNYSTGKCVRNPCSTVRPKKGYTCVVVYEDEDGYPCPPECDCQPDYHDKPCYEENNCGHSNKVCDYSTGKCVPDPCKTVDCKKGYTCVVVDGYCHDDDYPCPPKGECQPNYHEKPCYEKDNCDHSYQVCDTSSGKCMDNPCNTVRCKGGYKCVVVYKKCPHDEYPCYPKAECQPIDDKCYKDSDCKSNEICESGKCKENYCKDVYCRYGYECYIKKDQCKKAPCPPPVAACQLDQKCGEYTSCKSHEVCDRSTSKCIENPCNYAKCGPGKECRVNYVQCFKAPCPPLAQCVPKPGSCDGVKCDEGSHCENGYCVLDKACAAVLCPTGSYCYKGKCFKEVKCRKGECGPAQKCYEGSESCKKPHCPTKRICVTDRCPHVKCASGTHCVDGKCVPRHSCL